MSKNIRPLTVFFCLWLIAWLTMIAPLFGMTDEIIKALAGIPDGLWTLLMIGIGVYPVAKTMEAIASRNGTSRTRSRPQDSDK